MARFKYSGRDRRGKKSGVITANTKREAILQLREKGIKVTEVTEVAESLLTKDIYIGNPVKLQDFVIYLRQFATLLRAGVSVVEATNILAEQTESKALAKTLRLVEADLREGHPLSESVAKHPKIFSNMFIHMLKAGEAGGNLDDTLDRLAVHFEKQHHTRQKIVSALTYPLTVGFVAIIVVIFLLISVVPTFVDMFASLEGELPAITLFVLGASEWVQQYWWVLGLIFITIAIVFVMLRNNRQTKYYLDIIALKMPIFGGIVQKAALARMTRTLSSLFASSVPILQAIGIVENVVENEVISKVLQQSRNALEQGESLADPMKESWVFPPLVTQMVAIGEQSGALDAMLDKVADFYEQEVETASDQLKSLIEPLMIVLLAGMVGTIVIAILVPMFEIFQYVG